MNPAGDLVIGLRNAHGMEVRARELIERQCQRTGDYPAVQTRLRQHLLITLCGQAGMPELEASLRQSLGEEQGMAAWLDDHVEEVTLAYLAKKSAGARSGVSELT
jgi:ferritin-like metal-binding protein YciE